MAKTSAAGPKPVELRADENLLTTLWERVADKPDDEIAAFVIDDEWRSYTWQELGDRVHRTAGGLISSGLRPGQRVALMSERR